MVDDHVSSDCGILPARSADALTLLGSRNQRLIGSPLDGRRELFDTHGISRDPSKPSTLRVYTTHKSVFRYVRNTSLRWVKLAGTFFKEM